VSTGHFATYRLLYLFAGEARKGDLSSALHDLARHASVTVEVQEFDLVRGHDLLSDNVWLPLLRRVKNGEFTHLFMSPPCETFSRAPWANGHGPAPLRSADWPEGFPWLKGADKAKAETGTELVRRCLQLVTLAADQSLFWLMEHPEDLGPTSRGTPASIWSWWEARSLFNRLQASTVALYQCAFGSDYRKPTRLTGNWANLPALGFSGWPRFDGLRYVGPLPKKCGHQHEALIGKDASGRFRTKPTAAYGPGLCRALAECMLATTAPSSSVPMGQMIATDEAVFASSDPETCAQQLLSRHGRSTSFSSLSKLFGLLPGESPARGQETSSSKSFSVGAYSVGGSLAGLRKTTKSFPSVTKLLCAVVSGLDAGLKFTAVGIFKNLQTSPHKDSGNQSGCPNLVAALSDFSGGGIWIESDDGSFPCPFDDCKKQGEVLDIDFGSHIKFDPRRLHCTMPWGDSDRIVLVAYTPFFGPSLRDSDRKALAELGFQLPSATTSSSSTASGSRAAGGADPSGSKRPLEVSALGDDNDDGPAEWWQGSRPKGRWLQDAEGSTSEEDEDGHAKPKRGSGKLGFGAAMTTRTAGKVKFFSDGHGLASPGRWPPHARPCADLDPGLSLHKSLMDKLLGFITENIDYKKVVCFLATGKCVSSPFSEGLLKRARHLVFGVLRDQGSTAPLELVPERQPFHLHAISELLRLADDPDWRQYTESKHSFANGVPLGVDHRMPRNPALFERKRRHRDFTGLGAHECEELRDNYRSVDGFEAKVEQQFEKEIALGAMVKMDLREAQELFGDRLSIASLGCIPKTDGSVRVVHDGTHGQHVNDSIRVRDGQAYPSGADLEATLHSLPYATFSLSGDISRAHRLSKVREQD